MNKYKYINSFAKWFIGQQTYRLHVSNVYSVDEDYTFTFLEISNIKISLSNIPIDVSVTPIPTHTNIQIYAYHILLPMRNQSTCVSNQT